MTRPRALSDHAHRLLALFLAAPGEWRHGYELVQLTGVKTGTLYPLLIRLEAQGYLEAEWQPPSAAGRPPRHAYRLTESGIGLAREAASVSPGALPRRRQREATA